MKMEYKMRLGAELVKRSEFVQLIHRTRVENNDTKLQCDGKRNARELIDWDRENQLRTQFACNSSSRTPSTMTEVSLHDDQADRITHQSNGNNVQSRKRSHDEDEQDGSKKPAAKS